jgi:hypothetical protein
VEPIVVVLEGPFFGLLLSLQKVLVLLVCWGRFERVVAQILHDLDAVKDVAT